MSLPYGGKPSYADMVAAQKTPVFDAAIYAGGHDPTKVTLAWAFESMTQDPWFPVNQIPAHYCEPVLPPVAAPPIFLAIESGESKSEPEPEVPAEVIDTAPLPEVTVTEGGKELPFFGQLLLSSAATASTKEN